MSINIIHTYIYIERERELLVYVIRTIHKSDCFWSASLCLAPLKAPSSKSTHHVHLSVASKKPVQ